jgi:transcriptional regulator with XRE-family HTH domain
MDDFGQIAQRILKIQKESKLDRKSFCEKLGISPAILSHISSGRNNPSLELIQKIIKQFSDINLDWLLLGKGKMRLADAKESEPEVQPVIEKKPVVEEKVVEEVVAEAEKKEPIKEPVKVTFEKEKEHSKSEIVKTEIKHQDVEELLMKGTEDKRFKLMLLSYLIEEHSKQYKNLTAEIMKQLNNEKH